MKKEIYYTNEDIYQLLNKIAIAYEIKNKSFFQIKAYQNAAENIQNYPQNIYSVWKKDPSSIDEIPGIGDSILKKIDYLFSKNKLHPHIIEIFQDLHPAIFIFTKINGIGPKIAQKLTENLKFSQNEELALKQLIDYAKKGKIRNIEGMGEKSEKQILENTLSFYGNTSRIPLTQAQKIAKPILSYLQNEFPKTEFYLLGSLRRESSAIGDIDIAAKSEEPQPILTYFTNYPPSLQTIIKGEKKASIKLQDNIRVDLMVQPKDTFGSLLQHFTGSKQHNIKLREYANKLGYSLSEYGIKDNKTKEVKQFDNEKDFYNFLGLKFIPPKDRIGENEIYEAKL